MDKMSDPLKRFKELRDSLFSNILPPRWFKLTIPKGKRKKRAHKKWLKKTGQWAYLRAVEKQMHEVFIEYNLHEKINESFEDLLIYGHSEFDIGKYLQDKLKGEHIG